MPQVHGARCRHSGARR